MENPHKEYGAHGEDDALDPNKTASEYGNNPARMQSDSSGTDFGAADTTTGSGYDEAARETQDNHTSRLASEEPEGSESLIKAYNINDQAHAKSSRGDFHRTVSNFHHADEDQTEQEPDSD